MVLYEHIYLARQDVSQIAVEKLTQQFTQVIEQNGGKVKKTEYWGLRNLAYKIKKNKKAHYTLMNIEAPPDALKEMERQMRINEDIIRHLSIKVKEHEEAPSVIMQNRERETRTTHYQKTNEHTSDVNEEKNKKEQNNQEQINDREQEIIKQEGQQTNETEQINESENQQNTSSQNASNQEEEK